MLAKVKETISAYNLLSSGDSVLVGLSGGPDSVYLLYILKRLASQYGLKIFAAHINHGFRGKESDGDEEFCRDLCNKIGIPFFSKKVKIKKTEDAGRKARYAFFKDVANSVGANKIALGHNADDQAETILMRLLRGSGPKGLGGIPSVRILAESIDSKEKCSNILIIRPLISCFKSEIVGFLKQNKIKYRIDSSNLKTDFFRNKIRHKLIPYLEKYNPNIRNVLLNTGNNISLANDFLKKSVDKVLKRIHGSKVNIVFFNKLPLVIKQELIRELAESFDPSLNLDAKKVKDVLNLTSDTKGTKRIILSKNTELIREYNYLIFNNRQTKGHGYTKNLNIPGKAKINGILIKTSVCNKRSFQKRNCFEVMMDYDKISYPFIIRTRKPGDSFLPIGLNGRKKVKDIFIDAKVPEKHRDIVPIFVSGDEICWIPGYRIGEKFKITDQTKRVLKIAVKGVEKLWQTEV